MNRPESPYFAWGDSLASVEDIRDIFIPQLDINATLLLYFCLSSTFLVGTALRIIRFLDFDHRLQFGIKISDGLAVRTNQSISVSYTLLTAIRTFRYVIWKLVRGNWFLKAVLQRAEVASHVMHVMKVKRDSPGPYDQRLRSYPEPKRNRTELLLKVLPSSGSQWMRRFAIDFALPTRIFKFMASPSIRTG
jgi:hypothetical protein